MTVAREVVVVGDSVWGFGFIGSDYRLLAGPTVDASLHDKENDPEASMMSHGGLSSFSAWQAAS